MTKCLKVTIIGNFPEGYLRDHIQKHARNLHLEGTAQYMPNLSIRIFVCGTKEAVDQFLDALHKGTIQEVPQDVEVEPFVKDKDFRNVFRVIE